MTAKIIQRHEDSLHDPNVIVALLPMVMATGGMVGTQASSLVIRALTLGDLEPSSLLRVLWKELRISAVLAVVLSAIVFSEGWLLSDSDDQNLIIRASFGMAIAMAAHVVIAAILGAAIPLIAKWLGRDPAMVSTPAVTAIADLSGATIYVLVVVAFLAG